MPAHTATATEDAAVASLDTAASLDVAADKSSSDATFDLQALAAYQQENSYTINTLVMFACAVLVLLMQAGFAMLEVGLNAAKNTVNILFKNVMDLAVGVLLFLVVGFGLMYPYDSAGALEHPYFGFGGSWVEADATTGELGSYSSSVNFFFQVAFAATAATIVSGAVAGRMKFGAYLVYSAVLTGLIYPISGYWKWGEGFLHQWGFQDFAGSVVVHALGGFAALAGAIVLGPRIGRFTSDRKSVPMPGHNLAFAALGVLVLWVGWYGFNSGSQLTFAGAENASATTYIALTTTIAAAAGAVSAMVLAWILFKKPDVTMALNGVLAGLVGITANCDQVSQFSALCIGGVAGLLVVGGIVLLDKRCIDDPVGAFPVHGLCGVWGGIATGLFGTNLPADLTRFGYIRVQCLATLIVCAWAFVTMFGLFTLLKRLGVLRVTAEEEHAGLDLSEHGMHAYPAAVVAASTVVAPAERPAMLPVGEIATASSL